MEELKPEVKKFLEELDQDDIKKIESALRAYRVVELLGWFAKWSAITAFALLVALSQLGESILKIFKWFKV